MMDNVERFPIKHSQRIRNRRGKRSVSCIVSDRWLRFPPKAEQINEGTAIIVDVMTDAGENECERKLCTLILTLEEMQRVIDMYGGKK
jgi:hypothetical protein